jgi:hypothetical protein
LSSDPARGIGGSLPQGMETERSTADFRHMSAALVTKVAPAGSTRLLADVSALAGKDAVEKAPALDRLEAALGRDFADRLVAALSEERVDSRD